MLKNLGIYGLAPAITELQFVLEEGLTAIIQDALAAFHSKVVLNHFSFC